MRRAAETHTHEAVGGRLHHDTDIGNGLASQEHDAVQGKVVRHDQAPRRGLALRILYIDLKMRGSGSVRKGKKTWNVSISSGVLGSRVGFLKFPTQPCPTQAAPNRFNRSFATGDCARFMGDFFLAHVPPRASSLHGPAQVQRLSTLEEQEAQGEAIYCAGGVAVRDGDTALCAPQGPIAPSMPRVL
jgi:hypothetical protein